MSEKPRVYIAGIGMITPVGANAEMTAAAVRAGVSGYRDSNFFDRDCNNIRFASVPDEALEKSLDEEVLANSMTARQARMLQLAKLAMLEIIPKLPRDEKLPLFLAGPESLGVSDQTLNMSFIKNLALQTGAKLDLEKSRIDSMGRAGGLNCIRLAFRFLESTPTKFVLVGGVDSFYDKDVLDCLLTAERLLCGDAMDGFIAGEGAGFLLLTKDLSIRTNDRLPHMFEPGIGMEQGHIYSKKAYLGDGLATAVMGAIENATTSKIRTIYSTMNGESFFAKEHGVAVIRNNDAFHDKIDIEHPADCFGDLGAASGIVATALSAMRALNKDKASPILVCCSSDREYRSAAVVQV